MTTPDRSDGGIMRIARELPAIVMALLGIGGLVATLAMGYSDTRQTKNDVAALNAQNLNSRVTQLEGEAHDARAEGKEIRAALDINNQKLTSVETKLQILIDQPSLIRGRK